MGQFRGASSSHFKTTGFLLAFFLSGCGQQGVPEYLESAQSYLDKKDVPAAVIELKNALKQEPQNAKARRLLGESYLAMNNGAAAEKELLHAQELGVDAVILYPSLIRAFNLQNKFQQVVDLPMPSALAKSDKVLASVLRGVAFLGLKDKASAKLEFDTAYEMDSSALFSQLGQAYFATAEDQIDEAISLLDKLLTQEPDFNEALRLKAGLMNARKDYAAAAPLYRQLVKLNPQEFSYQLQLARVLIDLKEYQEAAEVLAPVLKRYPKHPMSNLLLADMEYQQQHYSQSRDAASLVLSSEPDNIRAKFLMGMCSYQLKDFEQAHRYLTAVESVTPPNHPLRRTLAYIQYEMGYLDQASETLSSLEKEGDDAHLLEAIGIKQVASNENQQALDTLQQALALDPDNYKLRARLGVLKLNEQDSSGLNDLEAAVSGDPSLNKVKLYEALYYVNQNQYDKALSMAKAWQEQDSDRIDGYNLEGLINFRQGKLDEAKALYNKVVALEPSNRTARGHLASIAITEQDLDKAKAQYLALLESYPGDESTLIRLSSIALQQNDTVQAKRYFEDALAKNSENGALRLRFAQLLATLKEYDAALAQLDMLPKAQRDTTDSQMMKGDLYLAKGEIEPARQQYQKVTSAEPKMLKAHVRLLDTYRQQQDLSGMMQVMEQAIKANPDSTELKHLEIVELIKAQQLQSAFKKIDALRADPKLLNLADELDAAAYMHNNEPEKALESLKKAYQREPSQIRVLRLNDYYRKVKEPAKGIALLEEYLKAHPDALRVKETVAVAINSSDPKRAEKLYRELIKANPENVTVLNNLAWMMAENGKVKEAVTHAQKAALLAPDRPAVLDTYGVALLANNLPKAALSNLEKAHSLAPEDRSIRFHLAQACVKVGQPDKAKTHLEALLGDGKAFPELEQAKALLKQL